MVILGLTGSIGMGKTTAAKAFRRLGVPVHDADATVHRLLGKGGAAVPLVEAAFPGVVVNGAVDRQALGARVFGDTPALRRLESILHPLVRRAELRFLRRQARRGTKLVVLDVPLLFETGGERRCDATAVVIAPPFVQAARVLRRPGMTRAKLADIRRRQMADSEKLRRADFVIHTGLGHLHSLRDIHRIVRTLRRWRGRKWPPALGHPGGRLTA